MLLDGPPEDADLLLQRALRQVRQEASGVREDAADPTPDTQRLTPLTPTPRVPRTLCPDSKHRCHFGAPRSR